MKCWHLVPMLLIALALFSLVPIVRGQSPVSLSWNGYYMPGESQSYAPQHTGMPVPVGATVDFQLGGIPLTSCAYTLNFGDGSQVVGQFTWLATVDHTYTQAGSFTAVLTACGGSSQMSISVGSSPFNGQDSLVGALTMLMGLVVIVDSLRPVGKPKDATAPEKEVEFLRPAQGGVVDLTGSRGLESVGKGKKTPLLRTQAQQASETTPQIPCSGLRDQIKSVNEDLRLTGELLQAKAQDLNDRASKGRIDTIAEAAVSIALGSAGAFAGASLELASVAEKFSAREAASEFIESLPLKDIPPTRFIEGVERQAGSRLHETARIIDVHHKISGRLDAGKSIVKGLEKPELEYCKKLAREINDLLTSQESGLRRLKALTMSYIVCLQANPGARSLIEREESKERAIERNKSSGPDITDTAPGSPVNDG